MKRLVALYRSPTYSPQQHLRNDTAILDETVEGLARRGWAVSKTGEAAVALGRLPPADLFVNMCQGPAASERLLRLVPLEALAVNPPASVLNCHRHRLVERMADAGLPFPRTLILPTSEPQAAALIVHLFNGDGRPVWVKRGDVHAETRADVVAATESTVTGAIADFARRGVARVALQAHVAGPILKFYALADGSFFHWYAADGAQAAVNEERLRALVFAVALPPSAGLASLPADGISLYRIPGTRGFVSRIWSEPWTLECCRSRASRGKPRPSQPAAHGSVCSSPPDGPPA